MNAKNIESCTLCERITEEVVMLFPYYSVIQWEKHFPSSEVYVLPSVSFAAWKDLSTCHSSPETVL